ncbi:MAG: DNA polymerase III subunit alpha [Spirochaetaceae bacterium]|nr:MAG: DNA polymerase III subunit alpha [Spirochaetaceae bacterium]
MYVPLWCKSNFSFLEGASHPDELVQVASAFGLPAIALTDRDGLYGIVRAHTEASRLGIKLIVGAEITIDDGRTIVLLARDGVGYANLSQLISKGRLRCEKGRSEVSWHELCAAAPGLVGIWNFGVVRPSRSIGGDHGRTASADGLRARANDVYDAFGEYLYAGITRHRLADDSRREHTIRRRADVYGVLPVAASEVLYHDPARRRLHDVVTAIRWNTQLTRAGTRLKPNGEFFLRTASDALSLYEDAPELLEKSVEVASLCTFSLSELEYRYPAEPLPTGVSSAEYLRTLALDGAGHRYPSGVPARVVRQIEKELALIEELQYCGYFLTMHEIVSYCRRNGILCQGRGSAANSAVCFCLGITAVDPVKMDLLFERFLSRERAEPPDIDLDIEHRRREEVITYMYERYGRERAAMVANVVRYRIKSAIRDVGKALGFSPTALDSATKLVGRNGSLPDGLRDAGLDPNAANGTFAGLITEILDFPRHLSIHPGGFLLGSRPVACIVPIENATMPGRTVIQWDKYDVEEMNLFKVDLLGLGALTHLDYCFRMLANDGIAVSMATIPPEDTETFRLLSRGDTVGVFQLESRAQMSMLPRLKPRTFYDLVIEVSIIRPGPITGGMVHPFLRRRSGEEPVEFPHPELEPVLGKTLGVPLFQEQVMRIAVVAADYTPGEADQLRRDMAAWRRSGRIEGHREKIIARMINKGIEREFAERVFEQIRGFGEYGFPESHAASFALIAYATAWMRTHHPEVFVCGLLNAWPMGFYSPATIVDDARRHGLTVLPIDINASDWDCTLEPLSRAVRMGLRYVAGLGERERKKILDARATGPFRSIDEIPSRTRLDERSLHALARAGAFDALGGDRRGALWSISGTVRRRDAAERTAETRAFAYDADEATPTFEALSQYDTIVWDYESSIHSTHGHPLEPLRDELSRIGLPDAHAVASLPDGSRVRYAGLVICRQRPGTAGGTVFITLEDETGLVNLIIWKSVYETFRSVVLTSACLGVTGRIQSKDGVVHIVVDSCFAPKLSRPPAEPESRDFH